MKFLLGKKIGMSQTFDEKGNVIPLTWIEAGPCFITQIKTIEKDGYKAIQIGFEKKTKNIKKTEKGKEYRYLKECRLKNDIFFNKKYKEWKIGEVIDNSIFQSGEKIKISGISKGKGFQGVVKRWGFRGASKTHGTKHMLRKPGSLGATDPERVFKGKKMAGRMGEERVTVKNLKIIEIDKEKNLLGIKGAVPGKKGTLLEIKN